MRQRTVLIANLHPGLRLDRRSVERTVHALDRHRKDLALPGPVLPGPGDISLVFMTDEALADLHGRFLGDPSPTDVITFPAPEDSSSPVTGEICISADAAGRQTGKGGSFSRELALYLVHGWLHLAGHGDLEPARRRLMRRAETRALGMLDREDALPHFSRRAYSRQKVRAVPGNRG